MAKERIGIMGGTFNPIHAGHIEMALRARDAARLDRVLVLPSGNPPHKTGIAPAEDRWRMVCAACAADRSLTPSRVELDRDGVIYTVDTLSILRQNYPQAELYYIIGSDTLMELRNWRQYETVLRMCSFLICPRATHWSPAEIAAERTRLTAMGGTFQTVRMDVIDVSSTDIRASLESRSPTPLLPLPVREYCLLTGLYGLTARVAQAQAWLPMLFRALSTKRFAHSLAVAYTARHLARTHGLDVNRAEVAGLLHDCAKCLPLADMQRLADEARVTDDPTLRETDRLLHAPVGAYVARRDYGMDDPEVLSAIANHTTGKPGMSRLDMAVFLADKIEPTRPSYPTLDRVRMLAEFSLEKAMIASIEGTAAYVRKGGKTMHPASLRTLAWLKENES
ncbi:MAG: bis(5'-nucleosyl)-tetraphosphatase (symmetrical) YqeK [Christensenellaceae bacterium]|nr:bis(5'-nucleosyl)-tetraphosphatase (symmetrical) YqeK [Christensenellaceae bacterium]